MRMTPLAGTEGAQFGVLQRGFQLHRGAELPVLRRVAPDHPAEPLERDGVPGYAMIADLQ